MIGVIVRPYQVLQDIMVHQRVMSSQVLPHLPFERPIVALADGTLDVIIFCGEERHVVIMQELLDPSVDELGALQSSNQSG